MAEVSSVAALGPQTVSALRLDRASCRCTKSVADTAQSYFVNNMARTHFNTWEEWLQLKRGHDRFNVKTKKIGSCLGQNGMKKILKNHLKKKKIFQNASFVERLFFTSIL